MAQIIFYEKPGCINNTRQKKLLREAGHTVIAKSLLTQSWSKQPQQLREFFNDKPVPEWFNRSAPDIKRGFINPKEMDEQQAISLMLEEPLLIRRPLMQIGIKKTSGFDEYEVDQWIGLLGKKTHGNLENCPKTQQKDSSHV